MNLIKEMNKSINDSLFSLLYSSVWKPTEDLCYHNMNLPIYHLTNNTFGTITWHFVRESISDKLQSYEFK